MFLEQKLKPSGLAAAQLILAAVVLISFAMMVCVAEYLAGNKEVINQQAQVSATQESTKSVEDETADKITKKINFSANILSDKEVYEILKEFASKSNTANIDDDNILLDAVEFQSGNIKEKLEKIEYDLKERRKFLADAIDGRGYTNAIVKVCIARSIIYNDLEHTCNLKDDSFVSTEDVDDITATEEIIPYFLTGFAYFKGGDYAKASYYLNQIVLHHQAEIDRWGELYFFDVSGDVYGKIYKKTIKVLSEIETADWQTYRNEEYGFEFKYPEGWNVAIEAYGDPEDAEIAPIFYLSLENKKDFKVRNFYIEIKMLETKEKAEMPEGMVFGEFTKIVENKTTGEKMYFKIVANSCMGGVCWQVDQEDQAIKDTKLFSKHWELIINSIKLLE